MHKNEPRKGLECSLNLVHVESTQDFVGYMQAITPGHVLGPFRRECLPARCTLKGSTFVLGMDGLTLQVSTAVICDHSGMLAHVRRICFIFRDQQWRTIFEHIRLMEVGRPRLCSILEVSC